jgi:hypothetical protein
MPKRQNTCKKSVANGTSETENADYFTKLGHNE